ncbi:hypothetical protein TELCIR_23282 [Teladorsagia circumcincta]|uniref:Uncharacterized protein n=1 Tax=Teladorsagia circumcincta TaxID=45464 RepID=A0A2G9TCT3_TELCI|nr:hypothetical protein TELCIR_23282 [Teladorsagia circumcincta]
MPKMIWYITYLLNSKYAARLIRSKSVVHWDFPKPVYAGRPELAWTATAIGEHHTKEAAEVLKMTFEV